MNIKTLIEKIDTTPIDSPFVTKIESLYNCTLDNNVKKVLSLDVHDLSLEEGDILRFLTHEEVLNSSSELAVDFLKLKLIPIIDTGDNDYITFDIQNNNWSKFNIVDQIKFKPKTSLDEYFDVK